MAFTVVIPARYASQRLPGKPLLDIAGKTMIERVYECASASEADRVIVATDDERIYDAVKAFGGEVCMTSTEHQSGTDRLQEVVATYQLAEDAIVVNVQGDEPLLPPTVIRQVAENLALNKEAISATLCEPIGDFDGASDTNAVKVVRDERQYALYFSRAPIPWDREHYGKNQNTSAPDICRRHIGIYAYRVALLNQFITWPVAALESVEKLEQLRILAHGLKIHVADACDAVPGGVDTPEDLQRVRKYFAS